MFTTWTMQPSNSQNMDHHRINDHCFRGIMFLVIRLWRLNTNGRVWVTMIFITNAVKPQSILYHALCSENLDVYCINNSFRARGITDLLLEIRSRIKMIFHNHMDSGWLVLHLQNLKMHVPLI